MGEQHVPLWHLRRKFQIVSGCLPDSLSPMAMGKSRGERLRGTDQGPGPSSSPNPHVPQASTISRAKGSDPGPCP